LFLFQFSDIRQQLSVVTLFSSIILLPLDVIISLLGFTHEVQRC
jgi:hypothetical protein